MRPWPVPTTGHGACDPQIQRGGLAGLSCQPVERGHLVGVPPARLGGGVHPGLYAVPRTVATRCAASARSHRPARSVPSKR